MLKFIKFKSSRSKSSAPRKGKSQKECVRNLTSKASLNEEYKEAFRTNSYLEIKTKAQGQLGRTSCDRLSSSPSSSSSLGFQVHFTDYLLEPRQETVHALMQELRFHRLVVKFFDSSSEACYICESILKCVHQTRANHRKIKRVIKISNKVCGDGRSSDLSPERVFSLVLEELSRFKSLENPLCNVNEAEFRCIHDSNAELLARLKSKRRRIIRKVKFFRFCKKAGGYGLVISHSVTMVALLVFALHSILGILAAPALLALCSSGLLKNKNNKKKKETKTMNKTDVSEEKLVTQLDIAAKGTFILMNDFDTLSRLAGRLSDEIDHRKTVAAMCVKSLKTEVLKEAVNEFDAHEERFSEQLQELEEHVYLCFHTINRSRRMVLEQITGHPQELEQCS